MYGDVNGNHSNSPPVFQGVGGVATGVPVTQANQFYNEYDHRNQQPLHHHHHGNQRTTSSTQWSSGLCGCCSDCSNCCITCWCPCITFGQIAEIVDQGKTSCGMSGALYGLLALFTGCACTCMYSCFYRSKLRRQYMLQERPCNDCLVHFCCECCALCQEYRELKHLGYDMSIGWHGNVETQNREVPAVRTPTPTAPMLQQGMTR